MRELELISKLEILKPCKALPKTFIMRFLKLVKLFAFTAEKLVSRSSFLPIAKSTS